MVVDRRKKKSRENCRHILYPFYVDVLHFLISSIKYSTELTISK